MNIKQIKLFINWNTTDWKVYFVNSKWRRMFWKKIIPQNQKLKKQNVHNEKVMNDIFIVDTYVLQDTKEWKEYIWINSWLYIKI